MNIHVGLQIALGGKGSRTDSTAEGTFARMRSIVYLQCTLTGEDAFTNDTFIRIALLRRAFELLDHVFQLNGRIETVEGEGERREKISEPSTCGDSLVHLRAIPFGIG